MVALPICWRSGSLQGIEFGAATLPWRSVGAALRSRAPVVVPMLGGQVRFDDIVLHPPAGDEGLRIRFGLALQGLQLGELSQSLGGPAFRGTLDGTIQLGSAHVCTPVTNAQIVSRRMLVKKKARQD